MTSSAILDVLGKMAAMRPIRQVVEVGFHNRFLTPYLPEARWLSADIWAPPNFAGFEGGLILFGEGLEQVPFYRIGEMAAAAMGHLDIGVLSLSLGSGWLIEDIGRRFAPTLAGLIDDESRVVVFLGRTEEIRAALSEQIKSEPAGELLPQSAKPASEEFIRQFAELTRFLEITSLADAGCGDFSWMERVSGQFQLYFGLDRDEALIVDLDGRFGARRGHFFAARDITDGPLPKVDAILCRDLFAQNGVEAVQAMLEQIKASGAKYLMASTTPGAAAPLDLSKPPFKLPPPFLQFVEEAGGTKLLGVWRIPETR